MSGMINVVPAVCGYCKFDFEHSRIGASTSAVCPICGTACPHVSFPPRPLPQSPLPSARDWKILFLTVCCQLALLVVGAVFISTTVEGTTSNNIVAADNGANTEKELLVPSAGSQKVAMQLTSLSFPEPITVDQAPALGTLMTPTVQPMTPPTKSEEKKPAPPAKSEEKKPEGKKTEAKGTEEKKSDSVPPPSISPKENQGWTEVGLPTPADRLRQATLALVEARMLCATDGAKSIQLALQAIRHFQESGQSIPVEAYWILGQCLATQSWGDALLEGVSPIEHLVTSLDGHWLLTGGVDRTVWLWDFMRTANGGEGLKLDSVDAPLAKIVFSPDLRLVAGGTVEGKIYLWNMTIQNPAEAVCALPNTVRGLRDLRISPDGRWLVAYGGPPNSSLGDSKRKRTPGSSTNSVHRAWTNDIVLAGFPDVAGSVKNGPGASLRHDVNAVWLWDLNAFQGTTPPSPIVLQGHEKAIHTMAISEDSRWLATGGEDATVRMFDLTRPFPDAEPTVLTGHRLGVTALAFAPDNAWIASGSRDNTIRIWKFSNSFSSAAATTLEGHLGWVSSLVVDRTGERLISGSFDKTIRIWTLPKDNRITPPPMVIQGDQGAIQQLAITSDGKKLVSLGVDSSLRIRSLKGTPENEHSLIIRNRTLPISKFSITLDDRWLIFNYDNLGNLADSGVRIWPLQLDDLLRSAQNEPFP